MAFSLYCKRQLQKAIAILTAIISVLYKLKIPQKIVNLRVNFRGKGLFLHVMGDQAIVQSRLQGIKG